VIIDTVAQTMEVELVFSGLEAVDTASHVHYCTSTPGTENAGVATLVPAFPGFPLGVTSGTYDHTFDLTASSNYNPAFVTVEGSVANALLAGLAEDESYMNVHTTLFPSGEISGLLTVARNARAVESVPAWYRTSGTRGHRARQIHAQQSVPVNNETENRSMTSLQLKKRFRLHYSFSIYDKGRVPHETIDRLRTGCSRLLVRGACSPGKR
jgi:hypothetical protein